MRYRFENLTGPLLGTLLGLGAAVGCQEGSPSSSSSTNWATCRTIKDCGAYVNAADCRGGYCVDREGARIPSGVVSSGGSGGAAGGDSTGGSRPNSGGSTGGTPDESGGAGPASGGSEVVAGSGGDAQSTGGSGSGGAGSVCTFDDGYFDCVEEEDCETLEYTSDCCGTRSVVGVNRNQLAALETVASACSATFPACGCAGPPYPVTQDGRFVSPGAEAGARCTMRRCESYLRTRPCGDSSCVEGELCVGYVSTTGPSESTERVCVPSPCEFPLDCTCGQALCDERTDRNRSCFVQVNNLESAQDLLCQDNFQ